MGIKEYVRQPPVYMFLFGIVGTILLALIFLLGAAYSCNVGGGTLQFPNFKCIEVDIVKACEHKGTIYKYPPLNKTIRNIKFTE